MGPVGDTIGDLIPDLIGTHGLASDPDEILLALGANLLHWWEPRSSLITFNGGNIQQIDPLAGTGALVQLTVGSQPQWEAAGGAGGAPSVHLHDSARRMTATISELSANHRTGVYAVISHSTSTTIDQIATTLHHTAPTVAHHFYGRNAASPHGIKMLADFDAGTDFNGRVNDYVSGDVLRSFRPLTAGARDEINGVLSTTQPSNTNGLIAVNRATLGHPSSGGTGVRISSFILTAEPVAAIDSVVRQYVAARFGLSV